MPKITLELEGKLTQVRIDQYGNLYYQYDWVDPDGGSQRVEHASEQLSEASPEVQAAVELLRAHGLSLIEG